MIKILKRYLSTGPLAFFNFSILTEFYFCTKGKNNFRINIIENKIKGVLESKKK